jgi:hypothetical protein
MSLSSLTFQKLTENAGFSPFGHENGYELPPQSHRAHGGLDYNSLDAARSLIMTIPGEQTLTSKRYVAA